MQENDGSSFHNYSFNMCLFCGIEVIDSERYQLSMSVNVIVLLLLLVVVVLVVCVCAHMCMRVCFSSFGFDDERLSFSLCFMGVV